MSAVFESHSYYFKNFRCDTWLKSLKHKKPSSFVACFIATSHFSSAAKNSKPKSDVIKTHNWSLELLGIWEPDFLLLLFLLWFKKKCLNVLMSVQLETYVLKRYFLRILQLEIWNIKNNVLCFCRLIRFLTSGNKSPDRFSGQTCGWEPVHQTGAGNVHLPPRRDLDPSSEDFPPAMTG